MSHAGFDLLLGELAFVAATLVGCSGEAEVTSAVSPQDAATVIDSPMTTDVRSGGMDVSNRPDRIDHPVDASLPDAVDVDARAGDVGADANELALCLRLMDPQDKFKVLTLSKSVDDQYLLLIQDDCRVYKALLPPGGASAFADWRNLLYAYNPDLWGCTDQPATGFALISTALPGVSAADTALLIELYLKAATQVLALSSREIASLRRDLQRLAGPLLTDGSTSFTLSRCPSEAGAEADAPSEAGAEADAPSEAGAEADAPSDVGVDDSATDEQRGDAEGGD